MEKLGTSFNLVEPSLISDAHHTVIAENTADITEDIMDC